MAWGLKLKMIWRNSLVVKIFIYSFVVVHLPLLSLFAYGSFVGELEFIPVLAVATLATLAASVFCLLLVLRYVRPIDGLADAVEDYRLTGSYIEPKSIGPARIRRLAQSIGEMVQVKEGAISALKTEANADPLTGVRNRRWFDQFAPSIVDSAAKTGQNLWVVLFDIDHFKIINDTHGHAIGDDVLRAVAGMAMDLLRPNDLIARVGGEEFCFTMVHNQPQPAMAAAERIRCAIGDWRHPALPDLRVTASFGVAGAKPIETSFEQILLGADNALYTAKRDGRNRTVLGQIPTDGPGAAQGNGGRPALP